MKKLMMIITIIILLFITIYEPEQEVIHIADEEELEVYSNDIEDIFDASHAVLLVEATDMSYEEIISRNDDYSTFGLTITEVLLIDVIKDDDLIVGEKLEIVEPIFTVEETSKKLVIQSRNFYKKMEAGETYLLFLHRNNDEYYFKNRYELTGFFQGQYNIRAFSNDPSDYIMEENFEHYMQLIESIKASQLFDEVIYE